MRTCHFYHLIEYIELAKMLKQSEASISEVKPEVAAEETITMPDLQNQQKATLNQRSSKPKSSKHKKRKILIIALFFFLIYYLSVRFLTPEKSISNRTAYQEAAIDFNTSLGKNYTWIQQKLDHFASETPTWMQRILLSLDPTHISTSTPIFLNLPNMAPVEDTLSFTNIKAICKTLRCAQLSLEPRYFGESRPMGDNSYLTQNLRYLTIQQMVQDVAYAITRIKTLKIFNITKENPWIVCGHSHSAMVAILLQSKYPHLASGVYASSPLDFHILAPAISERLYEAVISGGKKCRSVIHTLMQKVHEGVFGEQNQGFLLEMGRGTFLYPKEALYLFMSRLRQINREDFILFCSSLGQNVLQYSFQSMLLDTNTEDTDPMVYSAKQISSLEDWKYFQILRTKRAYEWLRCNQIGLFESNPSSQKKHLNFQQLDQNYFREYCSTVFSQQIWPNQGGIKQQLRRSLKNLNRSIIVHGFYDIWLPYAFKPQSSSGVSVYTVKCGVCTHSFDKRVDSSDEEVERVRKESMRRLQEWVKQAV